MAEVQPNAVIQLDILGVFELAQAAGVSPATMRAYLSRGQCPEPDLRLACGPLWHRSSVEPWLRERNGRLAKRLKRSGLQHARRRFRRTLKGEALKLAEERVRGGDAMDPEALKAALERAERARALLDKREQLRRGDQGIPF